MDVNLAEAAKRGDVNELRDLLAGNPFLMKPAELSGGENPLHIACMEGHADFVEKILCYRLEFAKELNRDGLSPLHIASAYGHLETVKELLKVGAHLCLVKGKDGRIPLHYAVVEGKTEVIDELLSAYLGSIKELTVAKETCFHIAIKYGQVEALGHLMSHVILLPRKDIKHVVNMKDDQGNSVLHLIAYMKEYGVLKFWLQKLKGFLEINSLNNRSGLTPLDTLVSEGAPIETQEILRLVGAKEAKKLRYTFMSPWLATRSYQLYIQDVSSESRNSMLVVAVLIVTATYQSMFSPPGGVWQGLGTNNNVTNAPNQWAGQSVLATEFPILFYIFVLCNSIGFFTSLMMLPRLTQGCSLQVPIKVSLYALGATYFACTFTGDFKFTAIASVVMFATFLCFYVTHLVRYTIKFP